MKDGGNAFPCFLGEANGWEEGMTLRDWFAGQALAGMCAGEPPNNHRGIAQWCYQMSDAMIAAREQSKENV